MRDCTLFVSSAGTITTANLLTTLLKIGAQECDVLYIHTGMALGLPAKGMSRNELLAALLEVLENLHVGTLVFPAFTFSFCNNEPFDIQRTRTPMGALNEFVRKSGKGVRSRDPLLSVYVLGDPLNLVDNLGKYSIGRDSSYDRLHHCGREVRFLFLGADMRECFTYTHYAEAMIGVPYRYDRMFRGTIVDNGVEARDQEAILYTCYANCRLNPVPVVHNAMLQAGQLCTATVGEATLCCFSEKEAWGTLQRLLGENPLCLTDGTYDPSVQDTSYDNSTRVVSVK